MWEPLRNALRVLVLALVAMITLALPILPELFGEFRQGTRMAFAQQGVLITPSATSTAAPASQTLTSEQKVEELTATATATPTFTATSTPTLTPQPAEIEPDSITINQQLDFWSGFGWGKIDPGMIWQQFLSLFSAQGSAAPTKTPEPGMSIATPLPPTSTPTVTSTPTYGPAVLSIYVNQTQAPQLNIFHPAISYSQGSVDIGVTQNPACNSLVMAPSGSSDAVTFESTVPAQPMEVNCYSIALAAGTLSPGEYTSKLFVDIADATPQAVNLTLKVKANPWWMFIMVALGVVITEMLINWNRRWRYDIGWNARRLEWFDLLSERLNWLFGKAYSGDAGTLSTALQLARTEMRAQVSSLRDWLKKGRSGDVKLANVPAATWQDREMLFPLRNSVEIYVSEPAEFLGKPDIVGRLGDQLDILRQVIHAHARAHLEAALGQADELYATFDGLFPEQGENIPYHRLRALYLGGKLTDEVIKTAWAKIEAIKESGKSLKHTFENSIKNLPRTELGQMAEACTKLAENLAKFKTEILDVTTEQRAMVDASTATRQPMKDLLRLLSELAPKRESADLNTKSADEPLHYPSTRISATVQDIEALLSGMDTNIDRLEPGNISANAIANQMLKRIRDHLYSAEEKMWNVKDESSLEQTWRELANDYRQDRHFFGLGERILRLSNSYGSEISTDYLKSAYKYLLEGKLLEAEVELERAEWYTKKTLAAVKAAMSREPRRRRLVSRLRDLLRLELQETLEVDWVSDSSGEMDREQLLERINSLLRAFSEWSKRVPVYVVVSSLLFLVIGILIGVFWMRAWRGVVVVGFVIALVFLVAPLTEKGKELWNRFLAALKQLGPAMERYWALIGWVVAILLAYVFWPWGLFAVLIMALLTLLFTTPGRVFRLYIREFFENFVPNLTRLAALALSQMLIIAVATALVVVTYDLAKGVDTWGTPFDFLAAFVWGIVANRVAEPAKTGWQKLVEDLSKPKTGAQAQTADAGAAEAGKKETPPA